MNKALIIQTAFIGDVILATALLEKWQQFYPNCQIDVLVRKGNESLLAEHPLVHQVLIWEKKRKKYAHLLNTLKKVRSASYDAVINLQRFTSTGILTAFSGASHKVGFKKNPWAFAFSKKVAHQIGDGTHEIERNQQLIAHLTNDSACFPKLCPPPQDYSAVAQYQQQPYICIAPTSVWHTKQLPPIKWVELIYKITKGFSIYLLGGPDDAALCEEILTATNNKQVVNLAGKLSLLQSAALMKTAQMNYVNDSAPLHMASAMNANVTVFFCSTVPSFGFGPLSDIQKTIEVKKDLPCRPCGLHGKKECPEQHFNCGYQIEIE